MRRRINMEGLRFGMLLILDHIEGIYWNAICDCGKRKIVNRNNLKNKTISSCGCYLKKRLVDIGKIQAVKNRKKFGYAASKKTYGTRKRGAKTRKIHFDITFEQFLEISSKNCYYCNIEPIQCCKYKSTYGDYYYNGMDRVDSNKGYTINNVVACCWNCNKAKSSLAQKEFLILVENIYNNRIKNENQ